MTFSIRSRQRLLWILAAVVSLAALGIPFLIHSASNYTYLHFAHENLSYRYFFNIRVLDGQGSAVWLPQGQLISALQNFIAFGIARFGGYSLLDVERTLDLYGFLSNLLILGSYFAVALTAVLVRNLTWFDRAMVLMVAPLTVFIIKGVAFYYILLPDYYPLSIVLISATVLLVLVQLRSRAGFSWKNIVITGAFCGLAASNKLTLAGPAGLAVLIAAARAPFSVGLFVGRLVVAGIVGAIVLLLVFITCYLLDIREALRAFGYWFRFLQSAGAETHEFWRTNFLLYLFGFNYIHTWVIFAAALVWFGLAVAWKKAWISRAGIVFFGVVFVSSLLYAGLIKRGAGSTFFELCCALLGLAAICLAVSLDPRRHQMACIAVVGAGIISGFSLYEYRQTWHTAKRWGEMTRLAWEIFHTRRNFGWNVEILEPNSEYALSSAEELIDIGTGVSGGWGFGISKPLDQYDLHLPVPPIVKARRMKEAMMPNATFTYSAVPSGRPEFNAIMWYEKWDVVADKPLRETNVAEREKWRALDRALIGSTSCRYWRVGFGNDRRVGFCRLAERKP